MNYIEAKEICKNREGHIINVEDYGDMNVYPCKYMINYCISKYNGYCTDELEPTKEFCFKCKYRNKDMGENFEINPDIMKEGK